MATDLRKLAIEVRGNAHAPYSGFHVGAVVRTESGKHFVGCNVENAAYPEGTCAEAGAIAAMVAAGERDLVEAYIIAGSDRPVPPCGGCRQKLAEFASSEAKITLATMDGQEQQTTVGELLPGAFGAADMAE
jgi:cytidine deaminase